MFDNQILEERKTWRCALTLSESIQNLCDGRLEGLWGVSGLPPPPNLRHRNTSALSGTSEMTEGAEMSKEG